ncbi:hypothetical protein D4R71_01675 [bacterium]|nr:MAG: hypothetical protein D4R71_01675 [bacterium]
MLTTKKFKRKNKMKKIVLILLAMLLTASLAFANEKEPIHGPTVLVPKAEIGGRATGDDCTDPIIITLPADLPYTDASQTTCGRGNTYSSTCLGSYDGGEDIIYRIDVTADVTVDITMDPKGTTWTGMLLDGSCPPDPSTCLYMDTGGSGNRTISGAALTSAGSPYYIMIDTWPSPNCIPDFDLAITVAAGPPPNDECANAEAIGEVTDYPFDTTPASASGLGTCMTSPDLWYVYTATADGTINVDLCGSTYDTKLAVYDGTCAALNELGCNDDSDYCNTRSLQSALLSIPVTNGTDYLIQVGGCSSSVGPGDITLYLITCPAPSDLVTSNIAIISADIGWTEAGTATTWEYDYGLAGYGPPAGAGTSTTSKPVNIIGLSANTTYDWYVRSDCGAKETSDWAGAETFTTACVAVTTFPWTEGFEDAWVGSPTAPPCWLVVDNNADGDKWYQNTVLAYVHSGTKSATIYTDYNSANDDWLITAPLDLSATDYRLKFWTRARSTYEPEELQVLLSTTNTDLSSFTNVLMASTLIDFTTYTEYTLSLDAYHSSTVYIAFVRNQAPADGYYLYIDDVTVEEIPSCPAPTALTETNIGIKSADLGWTEAGTATTWEYDYGLIGYGPPAGAGTSTTSKPVNITGLSANTTYDWYVRADCGAKETSTWAGPSTFTTSDGKAINPDPANNAINVDVTAKTFDWDDVLGSFGYTIDIGTATGLSDIVHNANCPTSTYTYGGPDWDYNEDYYWTITTYYTAKDVVIGDEWKFTTKCEAYALPIEEGFNAATIPDCWSATIVADLGTDPALTYVTSGTYPTCSPYEGTHMVKFNSFSCLNGSEIRLESPEFSTSGLTAAQVLFSMYEDPGYATYLDEGVTIQWSLDGTTWNDGTFYQRYNLTAGWYDKIYNLPAGAINQGSVYVGFLFHSQYGNNCYFDDVTIQESPSCPAPTALFTSDITDNTAVMNWTAGGSEPNWNIEWGDAGFSQGTGTMILNTTNPDTLTGLSSATMYDWYVQADCDGGTSKEESAWAGPITFGTTGAGTCDHYVVLTDDYGDGWNGGALDIYRNGIVAIADLTLASGAGPDTTDVIANAGDSIFFDYTAGSWAYENEYVVYRACDNLEIVHQGAGGVEPGDASIDYCCPPPTLAVSPSPYDFVNVPYNKTTTQVFTLSNIGVGTVTVTSSSDITLSGDPEFTIVNTFFSNGEPGSLPPDVITVEVQFAPGAEISYSTILSVVWAGSVKSQTDVTITGNGCTPVANDDCVNATPIVGPYPVSGSGSNECAYIDCPGLLDWNTIWYEIDLPYGCNDVEITICAVDTDPASVGIILMDDCACDDYIVRQDGLGAGWITCPSTFLGYNMIFPGVSGPSTWLWPAYLIGADGGIAFDYEINVTPCVTPNAPEDINVVVAGSNVTVSWTYHSELTYTVYSDTDPYGTFTTVEGTGIAADHLDITPIPGVPTFYRVTCDNPPKRMYSDGIGITEQAPKVIAPTRTEPSNQSRKRK